MTAPDPALALLTPEAVRERCGMVFDLAVEGKTRHFALDLARLDDAATRVVAEIRANYPDGKVPLHSRWRHFELNGRDLWRDVLPARPAYATDELARASMDLAALSVLLDAGAGAEWRYSDRATGATLGRSEGLALASLRLFESGVLSSEPHADPLRVDWAPLAGLTADELARAFQVSSINPLLGLEQRAQLLNNLARAMADAPSVFSRDGVIRFGHLYDYLKAQAVGGKIPARLILVTLLRYLGAAWPGARRVADVVIADAGDYAPLSDCGAADGIVPFHKLSQWLSYSLIEPLEQAGLTVIDLDGLTGLAEYRNGGLFIDAQVLCLKDPEDRERVHKPTDELIVEWRALTVILLDRVAARVREMLGADERSLPLGAVLQGGTWTAGRRIAADLRPGGIPPLKIAADGTLF